MGEVTLTGDHSEGGKINYVDKALSELLTGRQGSTPTTPPYGCSVKYASP